MSTMRCTMRKTGSGILAGLALLVASSTWASDGEWSSGGPFGGDIHDLIFDPVVPTTLYATTPGGIYRSDDGGVTFAAADAGIVATTIYPLPLMLDAEAHLRLYTSDSSGRIYRTTDRGETWEIVQSDLPAEIVPGRMVDIPVTTCGFLMGTGTQRFLGESMLWRTIDCGDTFTQIGSGLPGDVVVTALAFNPSAPNEVLVGINYDGGTHASIFRSIDGGLTFSPVLDESGVRGYTAPATDIRFGDSGVVWAVVDFQLFHSTDSGQTWTEVLPTGPGSAIVATSVFPAPGFPGKVYIARADGVLIVNYTATPVPDYQLIGFTQGLTPNPSYLASGNPLPAAVNRITATPGFPATGALYASTDGAGLFRRPPVDVMLLPPWSIAGPVNPAGVRVTTVQVHPNPVFSGRGAIPRGLRVLATQNSYSAAAPALYQSNDGGRDDWAAANNGLRAANLNALIFDPTTTNPAAGTIWYAGGDAAAAENDYRNAGLYASVDNATTWGLLEGNIPDVPNNNYADLGEVHALALDRRSCASPPGAGPCVTGPLNRLYATADGILLEPMPNTYAFSHQVLRSDDRGTTWIDLSGNPGFPVSRADAEITEKITPIAVATSPTDSNLVFVGTKADYLDQTPGSGQSPADLHSGLFRSTNRGATWTHITAGLDAKLNQTNTYLDVTAIVVHPNGSTVVVAATDLVSSGQSTIYRSTDAGLTFTRIDNGINGSVYLRALAMDPTNPNILYAVGSGFEANPGSVFKSPNGGQNWFSISVGLPAESAYAITVDPHDTANLLVGTDNGVWTIHQEPDADNDGIPDAIENAGPNGGDSNNDGFLDSTQPDVGSVGVALRGASSSRATVDVISGTGPGPTPCSQSVDVAANDPREFSIDADEAGFGFQYPGPALTFELQDCLTATVDITYHGSNFNPYGWQFRYFGPSIPGNADSIGWYGLPTVRARPTGPGKWRLLLSNAELGNYRPASDQAIRFVGVPACAVDDRLLASGFESGATVTPSCRIP